ncbi:DNA-binding transcriptional regulator, LysR family [Brevibacterium siliguriense]|uniref:DNA-binding transcriptional regulator, LysR family n=1 Tax=Brevibacterium siliguriense TaxID=1136497 RepID=A0A1H1ND77_9MICO|nr:LysR family transcriptional regulator [Brevibacterium siliguriense]SDR96892.1 DNA-binding transcriptional regulator, LysR family [Brevibacterium siliguriense]
MVINLSMHHLRAIEAVHRTENFTRAAEEIEVSQPALSRTVAEAERRIGTPLFERTTRKVTATVAGNEVALYAAHAVRSFDSSLTRISDFVTGSSGQVRISCLPSLAATGLPQVVHAFRRDYPDVELVIHDAAQDQVVPMVTDGTVDIGLVALTDTLPADLTVTPFLSDPFVAVVPRDHAFAARSWVRWEDFHGESFVGFNSVTSIAPMVRHALLQAGAETNEVQRADTVPAVGGLVAAGMGITAVPRLVVPLMNFSDLVSIPIAPTIERKLVLTSLAGAPLPRPVFNFKQRLLESAQA